MHALRRFIQEQMDARGWTAKDLAAASGISKQTLSVRLTDNRDRLSAPLDDPTVDGLAKAFGVDRRVVLVKVGEALGLPMGETVVVYSAERVSNEELLKVLADRLVKGAQHGTPTNPAGSAPANPRQRYDLAARSDAGDPEHAPDTTTGEESQDPGSDEPA